MNNLFHKCIGTLNIINLLAMQNGFYITMLNQAALKINDTHEVYRTVQYTFCFTLSVCRSPTWILNANKHILKAGKNVNAIVSEDYL